ncbi:MAG: Do family serine endopeptidase [Chthoniobacter sp.]|nr:Do family serine endopeptidase [Chthoniobacter sp.]
MNSSKWSFTGLAIVSAAVGALGLLMTQNAIGLENEKAAPPAVSQTVTAPVRAFSQAFEAVASQVRPAVVSVYSEKSVKMNSEDWNLPFGNGNNDLFRQFFGREWQGPQGQQSPQQQQHEYKVPQHGMGSGMILDKQGHILTNYHVVRDVDKLKVQLADKREFPAEVVGTDPKSDVAIIHIKGKVPENLPTVKLGASGALKVGDWVLAIGAPFGLTQTVTAGIISATGRSDVGIADYEDFLQTDAAINPGNSGGPLVNMDGEVIGMNTAIATGYGQFAGVGFAIPSDMIQGFVPTLSKGGTITRGFLGVTIQDLNDTLATQFKVHDTKGALVSGVKNDTPAGKAGLKAGDVIVGYNGQTIDNTRDLRKLVAATTPDSKVAMKVWRDGKETSLDVTVGKMPAQDLASTKGGSEQQSGEAGQLGLRVQPLTSELAKEFGYEGQHGVLISGVEPGSPAELADLQSGDLIEEANRQPVTTVDELRAALGKSKDMALLLIKRKDASLYVTLKMS